MTNLFKTSGFTNFSKLKGLIHVLTMPSLSPSMARGTITKVYNAVPGKAIAKYNIFADISAANIIKTNNPQEEIELEIELQDDLIFAEMLKPVGSIVVVGDPIAVFCEEEEDLKWVVEHQLDLTTPEKLAEAVETAHVTSVVWQAYVKSEKHSNSCG
jgi:pyruvate/2-oxoglutarate dehydrogenase complex dihydrolipoamide acyltransferase (E2) component